MKKREPGYNCRHPDCIYRGHGARSNHLANCDYLMYTGKCRITQKGGERAESCKLYVPKEKSQPKPKINTNPSVPQWDTLAMSLYKAGKSDVSIAEALGLSPHTVKNWRHRRGLKANPHQREKYTSFDNAKAMQLYKDGLVDTEIARIVGASAQTITNWRRDQGLPPNGRPFGERLELDWGLAMKLYEQGLNDHKIALEMGCSPKTVNRWRHKNNLPSKFTYKKEEAKPDGILQ